MRKVSVPLFTSAIIYCNKIGSMKGKHHIIIESARLKYEFDIRRNITIIQGDSATGKTTFPRKSIMSFIRFMRMSGTHPSRKIYQ